MSNCAGEQVFANKAGIVFVFLLHSRCVGRISAACTGADFDKGWRWGPYLSGRHHYACPPPVTGVIGQLTAKTRESSSNPCHLTQRRLPYADIIQTTSSSYPSIILFCSQSVNYYIHFQIFLTLHRHEVTSLNKDTRNCLQKNLI